MRKNSAADGGLISVAHVVHGPRVSYSATLTRAYSEKTGNARNVSRRIYVITGFPKNPTPPSKVRGAFGAAGYWVAGASEWRATGQRSQLFAVRTQYLGRPWVCTGARNRRRMAQRSQTARKAMQRQAGGWGRCPGEGAGAVGYMDASIAHASVERFCTVGWRQSASRQSRPLGCGRGSRQAGPRAEVSGFQSPDPGFRHDFLKRGRPKRRTTWIGTPSFLQLRCRFSSLAQ